MTQKLHRERALAAWINQTSVLHCETLDIVSGDASFRRYFRFNSDGVSYIAVDAPPEFEDSQIFITIAQAYADAGVIVPKVIAHDVAQGFYCLQDFGDAQFSDALNKQTVFDLYLRALDFLPAIQGCTEVEGQSLPLYDDALLASELHLFTHWLISVHLKITLTQQQMAMIDSTYAFLVEVFKQQPQAGVHRDYHSRNLMILPDQSIGVIDFQDAVIGPITYDCVSLLRDCYQAWPDEWIVDILHRHHQQFFAQYAWQDFKRWFDLVGMQRHIKASGIFTRLCHRDGKSGYLKDIPHTLDYLINIGENYPECEKFALWIKDTLKPAMLESLV